MRRTQAERLAAEIARDWAARLVAVSIEPHPVPAGSRGVIVRAFDTRTKQWQTWALGRDWERWKLGKRPPGG